MINIQNEKELYDFLKNNKLHLDGISNKFHLNDLHHVKNSINTIEMALVYAIHTHDVTVFNNLCSYDMKLAKLCYYGDAL